MPVFTRLRSRITQVPPRICRGTVPPRLLSSQATPGGDPRHHHEQATGEYFAFEVERPEDVLFSSRASLSAL